VQESRLADDVDDGRGQSKRRREPTAQRGGRRRKFYALRPPGVTALRQAYYTLRSMADGLEGRLETK